MDAQVREERQKGDDGNVTDRRNDRVLGVARTVTPLRMDVPTGPAHAGGQILPYDLFAAETTVLSYAFIYCL